MQTCLVPSVDGALLQTRMCSLITGDRLAGETVVNGGPCCHISEHVRSRSPDSLPGHSLD